MSGTPSAQVVLEPEDEARAFCYAAVSRLFYGPPDRELVGHFTHVDIGHADTPLAQAWQAMVRACESADLAAVRQEHDDLFIGVGQAPITLYTSNYAAPRTAERHLLALRGELEALGLGRAAHVGETEDHVSGVCDVMRWLIEAGRSEEEQRRFFSTYVDAAGTRLCDAITTSAGADFYRHAARFAETFFSVEREAFALLES